MKEAEPTHSASERGRGPMGEDLRSFIIYNDFGSAVRAKVALEAAILPHAAIPIGNSNYWRCDLLRDAFLREQAAIEAAAADVIILSLGSLQALPDVVEAWARRWIEHKEQRRYALGVLLHGETSTRGSKNRLGAAVERLAMESGADFLAVPRPSDMEGDLRQESSAESDTLGGGDPKKAYRRKGEFPTESA